MIYLNNSYPIFKPEMAESGLRKIDKTRFRVNDSWSRTIRVLEFKANKRKNHISSFGINVQTTDIFSIGR